MPPKTMFNFSDTSYLATNPFKSFVDEPVPPTTLTKGFGLFQSLKSCTQVTEKKQHVPRHPRFPQLAMSGMDVSKGSHRPGPGDWEDIQAVPGLVQGTPNFSPTSRIRIGSTAATLSTPQQEKKIFTHPSKTPKPVWKRHIPRHHRSGLGLTAGQRTVQASTGTVDEDWEDENDDVESVRIEPSTTISGGHIETPAEQQNPLFPESPAIISLKASEAPEPIVLLAIPTRKAIKAYETAEQKIICRMESITAEIDESKFSALVRSIVKRAVKDGALRSHLEALVIELVALHNNEHTESTIGELAESNNLGIQAGNEVIDEKVFEPFLRDLADARERHATARKSIAERYPPNPVWPKPGFTAPARVRLERVRLTPRDLEPTCLGKAGSYQPEVDPEGSYDGEDRDTKAHPHIENCSIYIMRSNCVTIRGVKICEYTDPEKINNFSAGVDLKEERGDQQVSKEIANEGRIVRESEDGFGNPEVPSGESTNFDLEIENNLERVYSTVINPGWILNLLEYTPGKLSEKQEDDDETTEEERNTSSNTQDLGPVLKLDEETKERNCMADAKEARKALMTTKGDMVVETPAGVGEPDGSNVPPENTGMINAVRQVIILDTTATENLPTATSTSTIWEHWFCIVFQWILSYTQELTTTLAPMILSQILTDRVFSVIDHHSAITGLSGISLLTILLGIVIDVVVIGIIGSGRLRISGIEREKRLRKVRGKKRTDLGLFQTAYTTEVEWFCSYGDSIKVGNETGEVAVGSDGEGPGETEGLKGFGPLDGGNGDQMGMAHLAVISPTPAVTGISPRYELSVGGGPQWLDASSETGVGAAAGSRSMALLLLSYFLWGRFNRLRSQPRGRG